MREIEVHIDGASKGNPGPSGIGVVVYQDGQIIKNLSYYIGNATNNVAEYTALIYALQQGLILNAEYIKINTDSQLLCRQLNKVYKIKSPQILGLYNQVLHLMSGFKKVLVGHISRKDNCIADKLANQAIKIQRRKTVFDKGR